MLDAKQIFSGVVGAILTAIALAFIAWLADLPDRIKVLTGIPSGAVVAFDLPACPTGWSDQNGRFSGLTIVGTWVVGTNNQGLTPGDYTHADIGGGEYVTLTVRQLPAHRHPYSGNAGATPKPKAGEGGGGVFDETTLRDNQTGRTGSSEPIDVRQRYISMLYCVRQ